MGLSQTTVDSLKAFGWDVLETGIILIIGIVLIKLLQNVIKKSLTKTKLDESVHKFILTGIKYALYIVLIIVILSALNIPTAPVLTVLGAGGAAIALALKDSLSNISSGIIILAHDFFKKGDEIEVAGTSGIVDAVDIMQTTIKTFDNKNITIPNSTITSSILTNYSKEKTRRVDIDFNVSYDAEIKKAKEILVNLALSDQCVLKEPAPVSQMTKYLDSACVVTLRVWCETPDYYSLRARLIENAKIAFKEQNIAIPYPQVDVHVVK